MKNNLSINQALLNSIEELKEELEQIHKESQLKEIERLKERQANNGIITFRGE